MTAKDDTKTWSFPDVSYINVDEKGDYIFNTHVHKLIERIETLTHELDEKRAEVIRLDATVKKLEAQTEKHEIEHQELVKYIEKSVNDFSLQFNETSIAIIKKMCKKIILKEIDKDDETLNNIVNDIVSKIKGDGLITVELSNADFNKIDKDESNRSVKYVKSDALQGGNVIVSSNIDGLMLNIDHVLDTILG